MAFTQTLIDAIIWARPFARVKVISRVNHGWCERLQRWESRKGIEQTFPYLSFLHAFKFIE